MPTTTLEFKARDRQAQAAFDNLQRELKQTENETRKANREFDDMQTGLSRTRRGASGLTTVLGSMKGAIAGLGIAVVGRELLDFGAASVRAAGQMEGLKRGLEAIEGDNATQRLRDFNEIAKLPGLNTPGIIRYSNALRSAGATTAEVDQIIVTFGQSIVGLGGSAADTSRAMLQLTQAFGENKISQENFSTIKELIPSFNRLAKEVFNTDGSMDSLNQTFQASGQTLGTFLLPLLARIREEIPAAPVDSYARSMDALTEEFEQFRIAIGEKLLPTVSEASRGLAEFFGHLTDYVRGTNEATQAIESFVASLSTAQDAGEVNQAIEKRIAFLEQEKAALDAAAVANTNLFRFRGRETDTGRRYRDIITELEQLQASQGNAAAQAEYLRGQQKQLQQQARALALEIQRLNEELQDSNPRRSPGGFARRREARAELAELQEQLGANAKALNALVSASTQTTSAITKADVQVENFILTLAKLKAEADDTRSALAGTFLNQLESDFQAAITASNTYYDERIRQAEAALAKEEQGSKEYNQLQALIFQLNRERSQEQTRLEEEEYKVYQRLVGERRRLAYALREIEVKGFRDAAAAGQQLTQELEQITSPRFRQELYEQIQLYQGLGLSFDEAVEHAKAAVRFNQLLLTSYQDTTTQAEKLASVHTETFDSVNRQILTATDHMRDFVDETQLAIQSLQVFDRNRIDDTGQASPFDDSRRATPTIPRVQRTTPLDTTPNEFGERFKQIQEEERALQRSLREQTRHYRQFANQVSRIFEGVATGRINSFEEVAQQFIAYSLRIVSRAVIENTILKGLDTDLTNTKIANLNRVAQAQAGLASNLGLPSLGNIGNFLSGGGTALGVSALLFPNESRNLLSGIKSEIGNFLENVGGMQEIVVQANIQNNLRIGDNEAREISDLTAELREEERA